MLDEVLGTRTVTYDGVKLDFTADWPVVDYRAEVRQAHRRSTSTEVRDCRR